MLLYLMRHGEAVSQNDWPSSDEKRPLTVDGRANVEKLAREWTRLKFLPARVFCSPYLRARQTAEALVPALGKTALEFRDDLSAGRSTNGMRTLLSGVLDSSNCLLVGHMPDFAVFAGKLTGDLSLMESSFRPGEIAAIDVPAGPIEWGRSTLLWRRRLEQWAKVTAAS